MSKLYHLEMITPERVFFDGVVESIIVPIGDGLVGIMADHEPTIYALDVGTIKLKVDNDWKTCTTARGFIEVRKDETLVFAQAFEWPDEIDVLRALEAKELAESHLRNRLSRQEYLQNKVSLARAMVRLQNGRGKGPQL